LLSVDLPFQRCELIGQIEIHPKGLCLTGFWAVMMTRHCSQG
jgi:hypothetical protein